MAEARPRVLVTGDRALYFAARCQLLALSVGAVLVRDPAGAAKRREAIAGTVIHVSAGQLVEVEFAPADH